MIDTYRLYRALATTVPWLPEAAARRGGELAGRLASTVPGPTFALVRRHLRRVLGTVPEAVLDAAVRDAYASYGRYWAEVFWYRPRHRSRVLSVTRIPRLSIVEEARAQGRGVVLAVPHVGNWEAPGLVAVEIGLPVLAVAEALDDPRITAWFVETRAAFGIDVVLADGSRATSARLLRHLSDGGAVALLADRDVTGRGIEVEFFGERTRLPAGPAALADRTGAPLVPVAPFFADGPGYDVVVDDPLPLDASLARAERIVEGTRRLARWMERTIATRPTQWHLFQPNWPSDREVRR